MIDGWQQSLPGHNVLRLVEDQIEEGRILEAPQPKGTAGGQRPYLRVLGTSVSGLDVTVYLDKDKITVARAALRPIAGAVPGTSENGKREVVAPVADLALCRQVITAVFEA